ncbi:MAG: site-specific integrase [Holophagales bacterium]|nr:site-specific integrase [Holophagales bacterium]
MESQEKVTPDALVEAFQEYLLRARGTDQVSRHQYGRYVRAFLREVFGDEPVDVAALSAPDVVRFVSSLVDRYQPRTMRGVGTALRSFFKFLRLQGLRDDRLDEAVPSVAARKLSELPRYLNDEQFERLLSSLSYSTPRERRDRAIILCAARLGLRASEVAKIQLEDIDWRASILNVRARKSGRGAALPLPHDVGEAIIEYLRDGRPATRSRHVFVLHHLRVGAPATSGVVSEAVKNALQQADIDAPSQGAHLLRHTLATRLIRRGASLKEIADLLGHRCLESTRVYAKLDLASLRKVAQPWPKVTS